MGVFERQRSRAYTVNNGMLNTNLMHAFLPKPVAASR
ncbi:UNVERIFIED_ORG: hypothetical protein J2Y81_004145 [Paraburkholderia sediminicola]|jgi:hypothetical protein|uniref:Uncharacterized protein n=1 Tax=Paraburkholderia aspalathi TaxID=1324617 RepID=A0A1I7DU59_9BURK|nr:hypothetical protein [Paraburkholderia sediminicola]CAE6757993.1 hypothetical protein R69746_03262 [Paraburkholderia aspalathi]SFU15199.1 hypothetical protein SAMN05192563_1011211 [Paraburkholderia aspalathi]